MSAVVISRMYTMPRGASALERATIRIADIVTRWAMRRAQLRLERREQLLSTLQDEQTRRPDIRDAEHMLAQMGVPRR